MPQRGTDRPQAVVPAVAAAPLDPQDLVRQVQLVVDDDQPIRRKLSSPTTSHGCSDNSTPPLVSGQPCSGEVCSAAVGAAGAGAASAVILMSDTG